MDEMVFKEGTHVFTANGEKVGEINRFVLDPTTKKVTHIVVKEGWLFSEDKVVPIRMVGSATDEKVVLKEDIPDLEQLPPFEEKHFVELNEAEMKPGEYPNYQYAPAYYWYPPSGYIGYPAYGLGFYSWPPVEITRHIPEDTVPLEEGSDVMSADDEHVGDVERIFVDSDSNKATHFLISQGLLFKDRKLVPVNWVKSVEENKVHLAVSSQLLERLPMYES